MYYLIILVLENVCYVLSLKNSQLCHHLCIYNRFSVQTLSISLTNNFVALFQFRIYKYIHIYTYISTYICIFIYKYMPTHISVQAYAYIYMYE